jgi:glycosyltransferase involved in cell wall biosynthesis
VSRPTVSVIVPCYGYADVLEGCVASVLAQEGVDVRILIADDCSPDDTPLVGPRLAESDDRVTYRRNAENQGLIATANAGLAWADGDYVVLLSADDLLAPGSLLRATTIMEASPGIGMVYGRPLFAYAGRPLPVPTGAGARPTCGRGRTGSACAAAALTTASPRPRSSCAPRSSALSAGTTPSAFTPAT